MSLACSADTGGGGKNPSGEGSTWGSLKTSIVSAWEASFWLDEFLFLFFLMRCTPVLGSTLSSTVQYDPFPRSVRGRATLTKHGLSDRLWRTEF